MYGIIFSVMFIIFIYFARRMYMKSLYYKETKTSFFDANFSTGHHGEYLTFKKLEKISCYKKILANVYIPTAQGTTEIDVLMICEYGIFVIESKNYSGWIYGNENQQMWTQVIYKKKRRFYNPIWQNETHKNHLQQLFNELDMSYFYSLIIFSKRCTLKKITYNKSSHLKVLKRNILLLYLMKKFKTQDKVLTIEQIDELYNRLSPYKLATKEVKEKHIKDIKKRIRK